MLKCVRVPFVRVLRLHPGTISVQMYVHIYSLVPEAKYALRYGRAWLHFEHTSGVLYSRRNAQLTLAEIECHGMVYGTYCD